MLGSGSAGQADFLGKIKKKIPSLPFPCCQTQEGAICCVSSQEPCPQLGRPWRAPAREARWHGDTPRWHSSASGDSRKPPVWLGHRHRDTDTGGPICIGTGEIPLGTLSLVTSRPLAAITAYEGPRWGASINRKMRNLTPVALLGKLRIRPGSHTAADTLFPPQAGPRSRSPLTPLQEAGFSPQPREAPPEQPAERFTH